MELVLQWMEHRKQGGQTQSGPLSGRSRLFFSFPWHPNLATFRNRQNEGKQSPIPSFLTLTCSIPEIKLLNLSQEGAAAKSPEQKPSTMALLPSVPCSIRSLSPSLLLFSSISLLSYPESRVVIVSFNSRGAQPRSRRAHFPYLRFAPT